VRRFSNQHFWVLLLAIVWLPTTAAAQLTPLSARFVADLDPDYRGTGSDPYFVAQLPHLILFSADDGIYGRELWRTDGTPAGTTLVVDLCPGPCDSNPQALWTAGPVAFLSVAGSLWRSDGTIGGTQLLYAGLEVGWKAHTPTRTTYFGGRVGDGPAGLWFTDGTPAGTRRVFEFALQLFDGPSQLTWWRGMLFFWTQSALNQGTLWRSDGTTQGTVPIRSFHPGPLAYSPFVILGAARHGLLLVVKTTARGSELWTIPSPSAKPVPLPQLVPGNAEPHWLSHGVVGDRLVIAAGIGKHRAQLYWSDGSQRALAPLMSFPNNGDLQLVDAPLQPVSANRSVFEVERGLVRELWSTDGTPQGTRFVRAVSLGRPESIVVDGWLYFAGHEPATGFEPWRTNGIVAARIRDTCPGPCDGNPTFRESAGEIWIQSSSAAYTPIFLRTSQAGSRIAAVLRLADSAANLLGVINGTALITNSTLHEGLEPWAWQATTGAFDALGDLNPSTSPTDSNPRDFQPFGDRVVFLASSATAGERFWVSDGTTAGTRRLEAANMRGVSRLAASAHTTAGLFLLAGSKGLGVFSAPDFSGRLWFWSGASTSIAALTPANITTRGQGLEVLGDRVYFAGGQPGLGDELWTSDGSPGGTRPFTSFGKPKPWWLGRSIALLGQAGGFLYFSASDSGLWRSDGSVAGTELVFRAVTSWSAGEAIVRDQQLFFVVEDRANPNCRSFELWQTSGRQKGLILPLEALGCQSVARVWFQGLGDHSFLIFAAVATASANASNMWLWLSDGTTAGTQLVHGGAAGPAPPPNATPPSTGQFFLGPNPQGLGWSLWSSDGTAEGTVVCESILPTGFSYAAVYPSSPSIYGVFTPPAAPAVLANRLVFRVRSPEATIRFLETEGTPGTSFLIGPELGFGEANGTTVAGGHLFFSGKSEHGKELWVLEVQP